MTSLIHVLSALPCQALISDWWEGQTGQCNVCPALQCLGTGMAARPAGVGATDESVLVSPDPLTSTQDAECVGSLETPRAQKHGMCTLALPKRDSRDWERPGPSTSALLAHAPSFPVGWAEGGGLCRLYPRAVMSASLPAERAFASSPPGSVLWPHLQHLGLHFWGVPVGTREVLLVAKCETDPRGIIMPKAWETSSPSEPRLGAPDKKHH